MLFTVSGSAALRFPHWEELYHLADISEFPFFSVFRNEMGLIWADVPGHMGAWERVPMSGLVGHSKPRSPLTD